MPRHRLRRMQFYLNAKCLNPHVFKQITIQHCSAFTVICTAIKKSLLLQQEKRVFLSRAVDLPKRRLFSYYHWLCCHTVTGFRRPQQDPCLGWYEFYIYFLLCNLNSRDDAAVFEDRKIPYHRAP